MEIQFDEGKARAIGVSNFSCKKLEDILAVARVPPAVNQVECHPCWQQSKLHTLCQAHNVHLSVTYLHLVMIYFIIDDGNDENDNNDGGGFHFGRDILHWDPRGQCG